MNYTISLFISILHACSYVSAAELTSAINDPIIISEYQRLKLPFTLAVSKEEAKESLNAVPALTMRQQILGYNGWEATHGPDCGGFHKHAETWNDHQYDEYFRAGFLREAIFLLTGVGDSWRVNKVWNKRDGYVNQEYRARIILSLYHKSKLLQLSSSKPETLHAIVAQHIRKNGVLLEKDGCGESLKKASLFLSDVTKAQISPAQYEKYIFTPQIIRITSTRDYRSEAHCTDLSAEDTLLTQLTLCVEYIMMQMIDVLGQDPVILRLGRQFHKQKLLEERLSSAQYERSTGILDDGKFESIGQAFEREHDLADVVNRALFRLIDTKIRYAYQTYIEPLGADTSFMNNDYTVNEEFLPKVAREEVHNYMPDFMSNPTLRKILDAEYVVVG